MKLITMMLALCIAAMAAGTSGVSSWQSFGGSAGEPPVLTVLESAPDHMVLSMTLPGFYLADRPGGGRAWRRPEIPGYYSQGEPGMPDLPSLTHLFALPSGASADITVLEVSSVTYDNMDIFPRQTPATDGPASDESFSISDDFYRGSESWPGQWVTTDMQGGWAGLNTARLVVTPFRYDPSERRMEVASEILFRVDFDSPGWDAALSLNPGMTPAMEELLLNWEQVEPRVSSGFRDDGVEYLFVCTEDNVDWVSELFQTHHYLGLRVRVETLSAPSTVPTIKSTIQSSYQAGVTRFVCIVGTYDELPSYDYGDYVGDFYYALMDAGTYPDIGVGRITGDSAQIVNQVDKILTGYSDYDFSSDRTPGVIPSETVLAAHPEDYPGKYTLCCNQVAAYPYSLCDITFTKVFPPEGGTKADVIAAIEDGVGTVGYRGHGSYYSWTWSPGWSRGDIYALSNTFMPPVFNIACDNGDYSPAHICISEAWQWAEGGSSGNLGATRSSYTTPNHDYMKEIYKYIFNAGLFRISETISAANTYVINQHGYYGRINSECYIWFGDPAMDIWTFDTAGEPGELQISHPTNILPGNQDLTLTITDDGTPVEGVDVTVTDGVDNYGGGMTFYQEGTTNSSGQVTLNVDVPSSGTVYMGAFKHDYRYDIRWVLIGESTGDSSPAPAGLTLNPPAPNPVTSSASITFSLGTSGAAELSVFDLAGRRVDTLADGALNAGSHSVEWNPGEDLASGIYFLRLRSGSGMASQRVMLITR